MTLKHFIERPVLASVISIVIVIGGLIGDAARGAVSRHRTPDGDGARLISGCQRRDDPEIGHRTARAGYQRCGGHDLHDFQRRFGQRKRNCLFPPGHRPRHGCRQRAEQSIARYGTAAFRSHADRCDDHEATDLHGEDFLALQPRRHIRRNVPVELLEDQHRTPHPPYRGCRRGLHARCRLLDAYLAQARCDGPVQTHPVGRDGGARRAEHRIGDRFAG